jgi:hypothetical protein
MGPSVKAGEIFSKGLSQEILTKMINKQKIAGKVLFIDELMVKFEIINNDNEIKFKIFLKQKK